MTGATKLDLRVQGRARPGSRIDADGRASLVGVRARRWVLVLALVGLASTALVVVLPFLHFAYRSASAHVAIETCAALASLLIAYLVYWRYRRTGLRRDLLLLTAFSVNAVAALFFSAIPAIAGIQGEFANWTPAIGRFVGAALLAYAAFGPLGRSRGAQVNAVVAVTCGILVAVEVALFGLATVKNIPLGIDPRVSPEQAGSVNLGGPPQVITLHVLHTLLYVVAAAGFLRRAGRDDDELMGWLAAACTLGALSRLNYVLFPSLYSSWVYAGDLFRLAFFAVLLIGAGREIRAYHERELERAALDERRRIACNLHDGLAQELTFLASEARWLAEDPEDAERLPHLASAAERALDEAREAIVVLTRSADEPLGELLGRAARNVADRLGAEVEVNVERGLELSSDAREEVTRIVREAVANATRHGGAELVRVELRSGNPVRLVVTDDGCGFDAAAPAPSSGGFGLTSMGERARRLGGRFEISSKPGLGTTVEVAFP